jgi:hypothetical protein
VTSTLYSSRCSASRGTASRMLSCPSSLICERAGRRSCAAPAGPLGQVIRDR